VRGEALDEHTLNRYERDGKQLQEARDKLTPTGKPPASLKRMVVRVTMEEPNELELQMAAIELAKIT
jgi:hypothetical protein